MRTIGIVNAFLEDTGLITATSYLLARGRILSGLFQVRLPLSETARLGIILGAIGLSEEIFPGDRYPYVADTLMTTLAVIAGGLGVGLICALVISVGSALLQPGIDWSLTTVSVFLIVAIANPLRRFNGIRYSPSYGMAAGLLGQSGALAARYLFAPLSGRLPDFWASIASIIANGFAMLLMTVVINDAWLRLNSEHNRLDAERYKVLASKAQLAALRARMHPHFLYNTLTTIAGMCEVSSLAQQTTVRLGDLMRTTLEASIEGSVCIRVELDHVRSYLDIEQQRIGERLRVVWNVDRTCYDIMVPPFSVQTLVENAINHGIAHVEGERTVEIVVRRGHNRVLVAVRDDGAGIIQSIRNDIRKDDEMAIHGTRVLSGQLTILFGRPARLRLYSKVDVGTIAAFAIPVVTSVVGGENVGSISDSRR